MIDFNMLEASAATTRLSLGAVHHANETAGAGYFADSGEEPVKDGTCWRSAQDSNQPYGLTSRDGLLTV